MSETAGTESIESLKSPYWGMDSRSPEWVWYPEVLARFAPMEEWADEDREDAEHMQMSEWRRRHPRPETSVPWEEVKRRWAERLTQSDDPEAKEFLRQLESER